MKKSARCFLLILLALVIFPNQLYAYDFSDMPRDWSTEALEYMVDRGLMKGTGGKILAEKNLTRAELITIINRKLFLEEKTSIENYWDMDPGAWYYPEFEKAVNYEIIKGSNNSLRPKDLVTREEAFVIIDRAISPEDKESSFIFQDDSYISNWSRDSIYRLLANNLIKGSLGKIDPKNNITRKEIAQVIFNISKIDLSDEDMDKNGREDLETDIKIEKNTDGVYKINTGEELKELLYKTLLNFEETVEFQTDNIEELSKFLDSAYIVNKILAENPDIDYGYNGYKIFKYKNKGLFKMQFFYTNTHIESFDEASLVKYRKTKEEMIRDKIEVENYVNKIVDQIIDINMTDLEKEKVIHDYIILNGDYADGHEYNMKRSYYTPYGILVDGEGVCDSYSKAFYLLAQKAGLEVEYVRGYGLGEFHSWNMVKLDGDWYHVDLTWNDQGGDQIIYTFFNLDDESISKTHILDKRYLDYPRAEGKKYHRNQLGFN